MPRKSTKTARVDDEFGDCHPLVRATIDAEKGMGIYGRHFQRLGILVGGDLMPRALRFMDCLLKACESRGWKVEASSERSETRIIPKKDAVEMSLREIHKKEGGTGLFRLRFELRRKDIRETKTERFENRLEEIVTAIAAEAEWLREWREEREESERKSRERHTVLKTEHDRRNELELQAMNYQKAVVIRALIGQVRKRYETEGGIDARTLPWIAWAESRAENYDPFENGYIQRTLKYTDLRADLICDGPEWTWRFPDVNDGHQAPM